MVTRLGLAGRVTGMSLWAHALLLLVRGRRLRGGLAPGTGFTSDEGAASPRPDCCRDEGSWHYRYPVGVARTGSTDARPFIRADVGSEGVAPYAKHPAYPVLLWLVGAGTAGGAGPLHRRHRRRRA